jgi:hypothetical protein
MYPPRFCRMLNFGAGGIFNAVHQKLVDAQQFLTFG